MIATLATLVSNSLTGLSWLSPVEIVAALAALTYGVGGLVALRLAGREPSAVTEPRSVATPRTRTRRELTLQLDVGSASRRH